MTPSPGRFRPRPTTVSLLLLVVVLAACASSPAPEVDPDPRGEPPTDRPIAPQVEPLPQLPERVPTALLLGSMLLESGNLRSALSYYRFAWESTRDDPDIGSRYVDLALRLGQVDAALDALDVLVQTFPADTVFARQRAELLALTDQPERALAAIDSLLAQDPEDEFSRHLRVDVLLSAGRPVEALRAIDGLIDDDPEQVFWRVRRGDVLLELGKPKRAEKEWMGAVVADTTSVDAIDRLAEFTRAEERPGDLIEFLEDRDEAGELGSPQRARLADLYLALDRREEAVAILLPMASRGELDARGRRVVADLLASLDRRDEAIELLVPLIEDPSPESAEALRTIGELRMEQGDAEGAVEMLERSVQLEPQDGDAHVSLLLAMTQAVPGLLDDSASDAARENFERALARAVTAVSDESLRQNFLMGAILRRVDRTGEAQPYLERAAALGPDDRRVLYDLAVVQESNRDYEGARSTLARLVALDPEDPHLKNFYGYLLADQGWELERAEELIRDAVAAEPENGAYIDSLGWVLFRLGRYEEALGHLIDAVNRVGDDPVVLEHLAECLAALDRHDEALRTFERARAIGGDDFGHLEGRIEAMREAVREGS